jgi:hypothetical protein
MKYILSLLTLFFPVLGSISAQTFEGDAYYSIVKDNSKTSRTCNIYCKGEKMKIEMVENENMTEEILVDFEKMETQRVISWFGKKTILVSKLNSEFKVADLGPMVYMLACNISGSSEQVNAGGVTANLVAAECSLNSAMISGEWWPCNQAGKKTENCLIGIPWNYEIKSENSTIKLVMEKINQHQVDDSIFEFDVAYEKLTNAELGKGFELIEKE